MDHFKFCGNFTWLLDRFKWIQSNLKQRYRSHLFVNLCGWIFWVQAPVSSTILHHGQIWLTLRLHQTTYIRGKPMRLSQLIAHKGRLISWMAKLHTLVIFRCSVSRCLIVVKLAECKMDCYAFPLPSQSVWMFTDRRVSIFFLKHFKNPFLRSFIYNTSLKIPPRLQCFSVCFYHTWVDGSGSCCLPNYIENTVGKLWGSREHLWRQSSKICIHTELGALDYLWGENDRQQLASSISSNSWFS